MKKKEKVKYELFDEKKDTPIYLQIAESLKELFFLAKYVDYGDSSEMSKYIDRNSKLISIRVLANRLGVKNNTILKAYKKLEEEKVVKSYHGKGYFFEEGIGVDVVRGKIIEEMLAESKEKFTIEGIEFEEDIEMQEKVFYKYMNKFYKKLLNGEARELEETWLEGEEKRNEEYLKEQEELLKKTAKEYVEKIAVFNMKEYFDEKFACLREGLKQLKEKEENNINMMLDEEMKSISKGIFGRFNIGASTRQWKEFKEKEYVEIITEDYARDKKVPESEIERIKIGIEKLKVSYERRVKNIEAQGNFKILKNTLKYIEKLEDEEFERQLRFQQNHLRKLRKEVYEEIYRVMIKRILKVSDEKYNKHIEDLNKDLSEIEEYNKKLGKKGE